ncbi:MAG: hypothetical protein JST20_09070 [Bacteroidetes bacterium]|nr:hypothetical protein [Bacteroidota bacterium]
MNITFSKAIVCSIAFFSVLTFQMFAAQDEITSKCGTYTPETISRFQAITQGKTITADRPTLQTSHSSPTGKFLIHYDTTGINAVSLTDIDKNGVPDWVDSTEIYLEYAYQIEVSEMGFPPPPSDGNAGGTPQYDFYIQDLSTFNTYGIYGITFPESSVSGGSFPRYTSFILLDNNFSKTDIRTNGKPVFNTYGYDALKVTTAHELHHAIQMGVYGVPTQSLDASVNEMTSTWMEYRVHPDMVDYVFYLNPFFTQNGNYSFGRSDPDYGYRYAIVLEYFHSLYGDMFIKRIWEIIGTGATPYQAIENACIERNTTLAEAWCKFMPWMYHTGKRAIQGKYFTKSSTFPELSIIRQGVYSPPSFTTTNSIRPYEIQFTQCRLPAEIASSTPDTVDFIITYPSTTDIINHYDRPGDYTLTCSTEALPYLIEGTRFKWNITSQNPEICQNHILTNGFSAATSEFVYPNPFHVDTDVSLYFPIPTNANYNDKIILTIYTLEWQSIFSGEIPANIYQNKRLVQWTPDIHLLPSGVYLYTLDIRDVTTLGKFTVIR